MENCKRSVIAINKKFKVKHFTRRPITTNKTRGQNKEKSKEKEDEKSKKKKYRQDMKQARILF